MRQLLLAIFALTVFCDHVRSQIPQSQQGSFGSAAKLKFQDLIENAFPQCNEFWMLGHSFDTMLDYALSTDEV
jgi:hypothetical protein